MCGCACNNNLSSPPAFTDAVVADDSNNTNLVITNLAGPVSLKLTSAHHLIACDSIRSGSHFGSAARGRECRPRLHRQAH